MSKLENQTQILLNDLQDLENSICPKYQEITFTNQSKKLIYEWKLPEIDISYYHHDEDLHREIDTAVKKLKSEPIGKTPLIWYSKQTERRN